MTRHPPHTPHTHTLYPLDPCLTRAVLSMSCEEGAPALPWHPHSPPTPRHAPQNWSFLTPPCPQPPTTRHIARHTTPTQLPYDDGAQGWAGYYAMALNYTRIQCSAHPAIVGGETGPARVVPQGSTCPHLFRSAANMPMVGLGVCARGPGPSWRLGALVLAWLGVKRTHACAWGPVSTVRWPFAAALSGPHSPPCPQPKCRISGAGACLLPSARDSVMCGEGAGPLFKL